MDANLDPQPGADTEARAASYPPAQCIRLDDVVSDVAPLLQLGLGPLVGLELALNAGAAKVSACRDDVVRILFDLVAGAREAMAGTGTLLVRTAAVFSADARLIVLEVTDSGPRVPPDELARLLTPQDAAPPSVRERRLLAVRELSARNGGHLELASGPSGGLTVRIAFAEIGVGV